MQAIDAQHTLNIENRLKAQPGVWNEPEQYSFVFHNSRNGQPLDHRYVLKALKQLLLKAGLPQTLCVHSLRHTAGTIFLQAGTPIQDVKSILGHSSIRTTIDTYYHTTDNSLADAAKRMDAAFAKLREASEASSATEVGEAIAS
jgi:site-specific recombinase XerD